VSLRYWAVVIGLAWVLLIGLVVSSCAPATPAPPLTTASEFTVTDYPQAHNVHCYVVEGHSVDNSGAISCLQLSQ